MNLFIETQNYISSWKFHWQFVSAALKAGAEDQDVWHAYCAL